jgi:superfamily II DNA or RNA helicase
MTLAKMLVPEQPLWTGAMSCFEYTPDMVQRMLLTDAFGDTYQLYRAVGDKILIPRGLAPVGAEDMRVAGVPAKFDKLDFAPRDPEQKRVVDEAVELLLDGKSFILEAPTGFGKTCVACPMIAAVGRVTLIVVPKADLMTRWRVELKKTLGLTDAEIGVIRQDSMAVAGKKVVVGMLHSLCRTDRYPAWIKQEVGCVIFDEVHRLGADEFMKVAGAFPAKLRLGLSATPDRRDGRQIAFQAHIGPVMVRTTMATVETKVLRVHTEWRCPRTKLGDKIPHSPGKDTHVKVLLSKNPVRNQKLLRLMLRCHAKGRQTVFFSEFVDHVRLMEEMLLSSGVMADDVGVYIGELKESERKIALKRQIVLATYGMMSEGTDEPRLDTCVLGTPRSDIRQASGRVMRAFPGKTQAVIIDPVDDDSPVFKGYARARAEWYRKQQADVVLLDPKTI